MLRTPRSLLAFSLIVASALGGCGGGSRSSSSPQPATSSSTPAPSVASAVAACKAAIAAAPSITPALKSKAEGICAKAASGNLAGARKAAREACEEVINAQPVPSAVKERALKSCASQ